MIELYRGSVQTWECDVMGHLNVRYYMARSQEAAVSLLLALSPTELGPRALRRRGLRLRAKGSHVRFHRELRPGAAFLIRGGVISQQGSVLRVGQELMTCADDTVAATFLLDLELAPAQSDPMSVSFEEELEWPGLLEGSGEARLDEVPSHMAPRGLSEQVPRARVDLDEAERLGLIPVYRGPALAEHCDAEGLVSPTGFMTFLSDGINHLVLSLRGEDRGSGGARGGAALEYRFVYRAPCRLGDVVVVRSGLKEVLGKARVFTHWVLDADSGEGLASAEAVAVSFDTETRRAIETPPEIRAQLEALVVPGLSL